MSQKWNRIGTLALVLILATPAWSDDPKNDGVIKQRVSPKLLREAMLLPEYQGPPAAAAPSLDSLKRLSEKLKACGDNENAELLQRFVQAHQQLVNQAESTAKSNRELLDVHCEVVEVNLEQLPKDSILLNQSLAAKTHEISQELAHLVKAKRAGC